MNLKTQKVLARIWKGVVVCAVFIVLFSWFFKSINAASAEDPEMFAERINERWTVAQHGPFSGVFTKSSNNAVVGIACGHEVEAGCTTTYSLPKFFCEPGETYPINIYRGEQMGQQKKYEGIALCANEATRSILFVYSKNDPNSFELDRLFMHEENLIFNFSIGDNIFVDVVDSSGFAEAFMRFIKITDEPSVQGTRT